MVFSVSLALFKFYDMIHENEFWEKHDNQTINVINCVAHISTPFLP